MSAAEHIVGPDTLLLQRRYWLHEKLGRVSMDRHNADVAHRADLDRRLSDPDRKTLEPYDLGPLDRATAAWVETVAEIEEVEKQIRERWLPKSGYVPESPMPETFGEALPERPNLRLIVSAEFMPATVELEPVAPLQVGVLEEGYVVNCNETVPNGDVAVLC